VIRASVTIVTWNSAGWIEPCLESVFAQQGVGTDVVVVDNASADDTVRRLQKSAERLKLIRNPENRGFAAAQNQAIRAAAGDWVLCLNPDVVLQPGFLRALLESAERHPTVGMATGKLLRMNPDGSRSSPPVLDSTGIYFTPTLRHLDRGSNEIDGGQFERAEFVFGATAAAALYRRAMIDDVSLGGEFFDEEFFAYREDADLAWRAQLAGWRCLYVPEAVGWHVRRVLPERRRGLPAALNYHSVKNRFLMRAKNIGWPLGWRLFVPMVVRDLAVAGYALLFEHSSLPAFSYLWRHRQRLREKRRLVQARRRVPDQALSRWFRFRPVSLPAEPAPLRVAILGTRGVPANYGGFETLAEELGSRLAARGHEVSVYGRRPHIQYEQPTYRGMRVVLLPTLPWKYFDTVVHTFLSVLHVAVRRADVVFVCNVANSPLVWLPRLAGKPTVLNVDGLDRRRRKWNWLGRAYLWLCEWLALLTPTAMVTDAQVMQDYYRRRYGKFSALIAYGAEPRDTRGASEVLARHGLTPGHYVLYVSRLEPENNPELVLRAYEQIQSDWRLAMVGGNPYRPGYVAQLRKTRDPRIVFTGPVYGDGYGQLQTNAGVYVHSTEVGGTHPALIEAMACGHCVLYLDTPENREVAGEAGLPFAASADELARLLARVLGEEALRREYGERARARARERYNWDTITSQYEDLFWRLGARRSAA
jgi:GT2 family glycosyltransferase/glycosyltransferase involved in cell wall biosynthesis